MKRYLFILVALFLLNQPSGNAQNLVLNPDFESVNAGNLLCSWYLSQAEFSAAMNNWTCPTGGSTDVFSSTLATSCFCSTNSTHASAKGPQAPRSGNTYVPIVVYGSGGCTPYREYVQGQLSSPMIIGQQYCIEFYVSMADYNHYATNNIGVYFTTAPISNGSMCVYSVTPHVNYSGAPITNATGWTQLSFTFTPTQAYTNFTIGNFYTDAATTATVVSGSLTTCRYYVEDVSIQLCSSAPVISVNNDTICQGESATLSATSSMGGTTYLWNTGATSSTIVVSPGSTTTYTVTGTSGGQTGSASATVTVMPPPTITITPTSASICPGGTATITAGGANTYSWSGGLGTGAVQTVSPGTTTTYTVTGTSTAGCTGTASVTVTVNPNPTVTITPTSASICPGGTATITAGGANTYSWSGGLGTGAVQTVSPGTTTTYTVTGTSTAGCTGTASVTVTVNPNPTVTITPTSASICPGGTATITAGGANTYSWSGGLGTGAVQTVSPGTTTTYTVTGTSTAGCTGTASVTVTVSPSLNVSISPSSPELCEGDSVLITANGGTSYTWSGGLGSNPSLTVSPVTTTSYSVTGTDAFGCTGTADVIVTVNPNPTIQVSPSSPGICAGDSVSLTASGGNTYLWSSGLGTNSTVIVAPNTTTSYSVTGTDVNGCSGFVTVSVDIYPDPVITATADPDTICSGNPTMVTGGGGVSYVWSNGNLNSAFTESPALTTTYSVVGTDGNGCTGSASVTVVVNPFLTVSITPQNSEICEGQFVDLTADSDGSNPVFSWNSGQNGQNITVNPSVTSTYVVSVADDFGCTGSADAIVEVNPVPLVDFEGIPLEGCVPVQVQFMNLSDPGDYLWDFGDGNNSVSGNPAHTYTVSGTYSVTLHVEASGCENSLTLSDYIHVYPIPVAGFHPSSQYLSEDQSMVQFQDESMGASIWLWDFGTGDQSTNQNPSYVFNGSGEYTVWQYVENQWGCRDSTSILITVTPVVTFYIPNAFSPNDDGRNDYFMPFGMNVEPEEFRMLIYDRWGMQIFRSDNLNTPWDGKTPEGNFIAQGTYVYVIKIKLNGIDKIYEGIVTVVY